MKRECVSFMEKAEWRAPSNLKVGDLAVVLYSFNPKANDAKFSDVSCGDTTVVEIAKNGRITLANGYKFHANGYGHSCNNAMVLSDRHVLARKANGDLDGEARPAEKLGHYRTF